MLRRQFTRLAGTGAVAVRVADPDPARPGGRAVEGRVYLSRAGRRFRLDLSA